MSIVSQPPCSKWLFTPCCERLMTAAAQIATAAISITQATRAHSESISSRAAALEQGTASLRRKAQASRLHGGLMIKVRV